MNLLLLRETQLLNTKQAELSPRQTSHLQEVLKVKNGQRLRVGVLNGNIGTGIVDTLHQPWRISLEQLETPPPTRLPASLVLALPRPQMIKRIMQTIATMGVENVYLIQTEKVEKNYWQSPNVSDASIESHLIMGAEQGIDTILPKVTKFPRFRDFIDNALPEICVRKTCLVADPKAIDAAPSLDNKKHALLAIGPEGGFTSSEIELFEGLGFSGFHLGRRILKVETAVPVILSSVFTLSTF